MCARRNSSIYDFPRVPCDVFVDMQHSCEGQCRIRFFCFPLFEKMKLHSKTYSGVPCFSCTHTHTHTICSDSGEQREHAPVPNLHCPWTFQFFSSSHTCLCRPVEESPCQFGTTSSRSSRSYIPPSARTTAAPNHMPEMQCGVVGSPFVAETRVFTICLDTRFCMCPS